MINPLYLAEIEARANQATVQPWTVSEAGTEVMALQAEQPSVIVDTKFFADEPITDQMRADAAFIAHARTDIPSLIEAVRWANNELAKFAERAARLQAELQVVKSDRARFRAALDKRHGAHTRQQVQVRLDRYLNVAEAIDAGLRGSPFHWGEGQRIAYTAKALDLGLTLVTKTALERLGYRLRRGVIPVGTAYFGSPVKRNCDLYVLECQCARVEKEQPK